MKLCPIIMIISLSICLEADANTHCMTSDTGSMIAYSNEGRHQILFSVSIPVLPMAFTASPSGLLCYVETVDGYQSSYYESYEDMEVNTPEYLGGNPYKPDWVVCRLHVCDASGEDKYVVPIEQRYGNTYYEARFIGDSHLLLLDYIRDIGITKKLYIAFKTGEKFGCVHGMKNGESNFIWDETASPDGKHLLYKVNNTIYMDGNPVLPRYIDNPPAMGQHPKEYRAREEAMNAELGKSKIEMLPCDRLSYGAWSPDGRYFAFLDQSRIHAPYQETDRPRVLILDTEAVGPKKTFADYTRQMAIPDPAAINMTLQLKWEKATDSIVLHAYNSSEPLRSIKTSEMKGWTVAEPSTE